MRTRDCGAPGDAGRNRIQGPDGNGLSEHGWAINNRRGGGLPQQTICMFQCLIQTLGTG
jgi:hypothetical protein